MEIRKLCADDYDELLAMLNTTFGTKNRRETDFLNELPKMWVRDDEHLGHHLGLFEDGVLAATVGIYPFTVHIGNHSFLFATTGNVATLPQYEGRGYFNTLFSMAMEELKNLGADAARLGGARQRYGRFGFEAAGTAYHFTFNKNNRTKFYGDAGQDITFLPIRREDTEILAYCDKLSRTAALYVERSAVEGFRDVYLALCSKHAAPYLALRDGKPIGYLAAKADNQFVGQSVNGRHILELRTEAEDDYIPVVCAWQRHVGTEITLSLPPHMPRLVRALCAGAESVSVGSPSRFKIVNFAGITDALMKLKPHLPAGEVILSVTGYGNLRLFSDGTAAGCEKTGLPAEITLDPCAATRLLFGPLGPETVIPHHPVLSAWLPLPLSWDTLDYV